MALIKCPECGKENVSDSAESCPECGYNIKAYFEKKEQMKKGANRNENKKEKTPFTLVSIIVLLVIAAIFYAIYQNGKCQSRNCDGRAVKNSRYCEKHTCTVDGCYNYKDGWSNVCETHHQENLQSLEEDNSIEELEKELIEKYGEDIFSDEMHMPKCKYSGCEEDGTGTYGGKWYCSKHLYEMQGYGDIISK